MLWISWEGFHETSKIITRFAATRLMPSPPALVEIRNNLQTNPESDPTVGSNAKRSFYKPSAVVTFIIKHFACSVSTLDGCGTIQSEVVQSQRPRALVFIEFAIPFLVILLGIIIYQRQEVLNHIERVERLRKDQPVENQNINFPLQSVTKLHLQLITDGFTFLQDFKQHLQFSRMFQVIQLLLGNHRHPPLGGVFIFLLLDIWKIFLCKETSVLGINDIRTISGP